MASTTAELVAVIRAKNEASPVLQGVKKDLEAMSGTLRAVGAGMTAVGVAGLKMVGDAKQLNAQLGQTALTVGSTTKEMRDLALATANVTFPVKDVVATFEILARAGLRSTDEIQKSANAFDALADATGGAASQLAEMLIPAFKNLGVALPQTSEELDAFTWLTKNTTVDLNDFAMAMQYVAAYGKGLNVSIQEMIAIMGALEARGISGTAVTIKFRQAVTQAAKEGKSLTEVLGLSAEEMQNLSSRISSATGITDKYAKVANTQYGIMDKLKEAYQELTLRLGSVLEPLEGVFAGMAALGPIMIGLSTKTGAATAAYVVHIAVLAAHKVATLASAAAQWALNAAMMANPIGLIIAAVAALVAGIIALWKNWDRVTSFFTRKTKDMSDSTQEEMKKQVEALDKLGKAADKNTETAIDDIRKKYGVIKDYGQKETQTLMDQARAASSIREKEIGDELTALQTAHDNKIRIWNSEYDYQVGLWDTETNDAVKQLRKQIEAIDDKAAAERVAETETRLMKAVATAKTNEDRIAAQKELDDFLKEQSRELLKDVYQGQIDALLEDNEKRKDALKTELDDKVTHETNLYNATKTGLENRRDLLKSELDQKLIDLETERQAYEDTQNAMLDALKLRITEEKALLAPSEGGNESEQLFPPEAKSWWDKMKSPDITEDEPDWLKNLHFDGGGVVPGYLGEPVPVIAHGGEVIGQPGQAGLTINVSQLVVREEADIQKVARALYRMQQMRI